MKNFIITKCMNYIKKNTNYNGTKLKEIKYGLEGIYITFSKFIIITIVSCLLGLFKETLIFTLIYTGLRLTSFGLHATKSWICLLTSLVIFIFIPFLCIHMSISSLLKYIIGGIGTLLMLKNSPADTYKKPIINKRKRLAYKLISTTTSIIYSVLSIYHSNNFVSNCLIFSIILQNIMISPITYKCFKLPYNNYKKYIKNN